MPSQLKLKARLSQPSYKLNL